MATIDPNIAMGYKPIQIESPLNQLAAYSQIQGAQQGQQMNALKMRQAQQEFDTQNRLGKAYAGATNRATGEIDYNRLIGALAEDESSATAIPGVIKSKKDVELAAQQLKTQQATEQKTKIETEGLTFKQKIDKQNKALAAIAALDTPAAALADINKHLASGEIDQNQADKLRASIANEPNFRNWQKSTLLNVLDAKDRLVTEETARANLVREQNLKRQTDISGGQLNLAERRLAADLDPNVQAKLAASKAAGTTTGKTQAAAAIALPNAIATSESLLSKLDAMIGTEVKDKTGKVTISGTEPHPGFRGAVGMGRLTTLGIPGVEQLIPGTPAADFKARFDEIMGGAFLEAFETLKGGGAITETEGKKATAAKTRMSLAQSENEFLAAAREYKDIVKTGIERARKKAGQAPSGGIDYDALVNKYTQ
jgi:hypothetical protein